MSNVEFKKWPCRMSLRVKIVCHMSLRSPCRMSILRNGRVAVSNLRNGRVAVSNLVVQTHPNVVCTLLAVIEGSTELATGLQHSLLGTGHMGREGGCYKMAKLRVRNFLCPPPPSRQGKTPPPPPPHTPFKEWKLFAPPPPPLQYG